ncbi:cytochrome c oxidase assembly factor 7 [Stigmatopora nigra]
MAGLINFEDEKEVQEYLDNLGMEYSYQCYKEKDPEGCQRLADYMEGVKQNFEATAQVLKHNCETYNHAESCYKLGSYHAVGKGGVTECLKSAYSCFMRACDAGGKKSIDACHNVGLLAHDGRAMEGGTTDLDAARRYYEKACSAGFAPSCFNLSALYIEGNAKGLKPNMAAAFEYAKRACELGHVWGCANASRMCKLGEGVEKDEKKAEELKNRARELHGVQREKQIKFGE